MSSVSAWTKMAAINLPSDLGRWVREDMAGIIVHIETDDPISDVVKREGYYVVDHRNVY